MSDVKPIPGYSRYGITENGKIFNLKTGKELRTTKNPRGYHVTVLVNDRGERRGVKRHRLVALAHLEWPSDDIENYVVNHLDSTPGNDWKSNLEWCTQKENVEHWKEHGVEKKTVKLEVLDTASNTTVRYNSIGECSKALSIDRYSIRHRLDRGSEYVWPEGKRYRVGHSDTEWPAVREFRFGRKREVVLKSLKNGRVFYLNSLSDSLSLIGYKLSAVWKWANDPTQPVVPGLYQIQFASGFQGWRVVDDPFEELQKGMRNKVVFTFTEDWGDPIWYESARVCAESNDLKATALNYRLKSKGQCVYNDGRRYCYYDDLAEAQKKTIRYEIPFEGRVQRPSKTTVDSIDSMTSV